jgi:hypothetical protein
MMLMNIDDVHAIDLRGYSCYGDSDWDDDLEIVI